MLYCWNAVLWQIEAVHPCETELANWSLSPRVFNTLAKKESESNRVHCPKANNPAKESTATDDDDANNTNSADGGKEINCHAERKSCLCSDGRIPAWNHFNLQLRFTPLSIAQ
ncbi:hypothetical protein PROFUN_00456 [Planoprotostelium fungivorum]|uniref:Uncharacterized protein n=1 Tax=Planoprotostelium fungivorum TaxID=1890364 RepID=A0A2P6N0W2_9EUKA|nr:hypothetical protein PROFUN_00456 [Planoprotostelium fungivorum]